MQDILIQIKNEAMALIVGAEERDIEQIYIGFLGKKGKLTLAMRDIPKLDIEERAEIGRLANEIKDILEDQINDKRKEFKNTPKTSTQSSSGKKQFENIDVTLPESKPPLGSLHLVTQAIE